MNTISQITRAKLVWNLTLETLQNQADPDIFTHIFLNFSPLTYDGRTLILLGPEGPTLKTTLIRLAQPLLIALHTAHSAPLKVHFCSPSDCKAKPNFRTATHTMPDAKSNLKLYTAFSAAL